MFIIVRSNDGFNFPLGWIKYIVIVFSWRYLMVKLHPCIFWSILWSLGGALRRGFSAVISSGLWSVITWKGCPYRYVWKWLVLNSEHFLVNVWVVALCLVERFGCECNRLTILQNCCTKAFHSTVYLQHGGFCWVRVFDAQLCWDCCFELVEALGVVFRHLRRSLSSYDFTIKYRQAKERLWPWQTLCRGCQIQRTRVQSSWIAELMALRWQQW